MAPSYSIRSRRGMGPISSGSRPVSTKNQKPSLAPASRRLWDTATHEVVAILPHDSLGHGVVFSPDGRRLAAGCADNSIRLWDVATARRAGGKELLEAE